MTSNNDTQTDNVVEEINIKHVKNASPVTKKSYTVTKKVLRESIIDGDGKVISRGCEGIFKNGTVYKPGDSIELDEATAEAFLALGEVE